MATSQNTTRSITDSEFVSEFKPIQNHIFNDANYGGCLFGTTGAEFEYVQSIMAEQPLRIWTLHDDWSISSGIHSVNRAGYLVTQIPAEENVNYEIFDEDIEEDGSFSGDE